ncbi:alpha/beta hydrolase [Streptacidiphilus sp. ASG 303]|uniref:alpha/beta hydrolase n=1 Tax=Streptacidiphilus sp. ASG 303 TaxID=2896847 RepID=UPI001E4D5E75|nr:alpha/beta hydrolase [Streptacidiphilus sp. ASG 303]MCD0485378.1 alpha/beta hydrolase [Streptacidiphilus sp. ASG 303]
MSDALRGGGPHRAAPAARAAVSAVSAAAPPTAVAPPTAAACGPAEEERRALGRPPVEPPRTLRYGGHPDQVCDLWRAADPDAPTVLLLHGGFWKQQYDRRHLSPLAAHLAASGFHAVLAEYRRVGGAGGWPGTLDDTAALVDAAASGTLAADVPSSGRAPLLLGHSAGGHLALWAAARHLLPADAPWRGGRRPRGVLAVAPVADLAAAVADGSGGGAAAALLGGADRVAERLPYADPAALGPTGVPTVVVHGEDDPDVPVARSRAYAAADPAVRMLPLPGVGHFAPVDPGTAACGVLLDALRALDAATTAPAAAPPADGAPEAPEEGGR